MIGPFLFLLRALACLLGLGKVLENFFAFEEMVEGLLKVIFLIEKVGPFVPGLRLREGRARV